MLSTPTTKPDPDRIAPTLAVVAAWKEAIGFDDYDDEGRCCGRCDMTGGQCAYRMLVDPSKVMNDETKANR